jgi:hypothetical protein
VSEKIVTDCVVCPFADDGEREGVASPVWTCHAQYDENGWPRRIARDEGFDKPPAWCPLRTAPIVVRIALEPVS